MSFFNSLGRGFGRNANRKGKAPPIPDMPSSSSSFGSGPGSSSAGIVQRPGTQGSVRPLFMCKPFINAHLLKGNFKTIVVLPKYVDKGEWVALNVFEFFEYLKHFNSVVAEFCQTCPSMSAGPGTDYYWLNADKKPRPLPAATYIEYVMTWINNRLSDETLFPTRPQNAVTGANTTTVIPAPAANQGNAQTWIGKEGGFPPQYFAQCQAIYKQMFRVFAHIYHTHFDKIVHLSLEAHLNSFFAHFISFSREFDLLDKRDLDPLRQLIDAFDERGILKSSTAAPAAPAAT